jgi:hypothetical protein
MTIEHIMLLASVAQTPRDWAEVRAAILALLDAEAEACAGINAEIAHWMECGAGELDPGERLRQAERKIRARIAARKGGNDD